MVSPTYQLRVRLLEDSVLQGETILHIRFPRIDCSAYAIWRCLCLTSKL
jgi:hypothetical protein